MNRKSVSAMAGLLALAALGCGGSSDSRPATWAYISPVILQPNCATANCHSRLAQRGNVDLSTMSSGAKTLLPWKSLLPMLLRGTVSGMQRMPPDFPLSDADIELIEAWIAAGGATQ
jgi:hypothetical protein